MERMTRIGARHQKLLETRSSYVKPSKSSLHVDGEVIGVEKSVEENLLAILDISGVKDAEDIEDDKINFIEALHTVSIASIVPNVPTMKLFKAIIQGLQGSQTMELTMASYQLLSDLNKVFPHVSINAAASDEGVRLIINHKVWTPCAPDMGDIDGKRDHVQSSQDADLVSIDILNLPSLLQSILAYFGEKKVNPCLQQSNKNLGRSLIFRYLITLLWTDFDCRMKVFEACRDETLLQNSLLSYHLKGQDKKTYTDFVRNLLHIIATTAKSSEDQMSTLDQNAEESDTHGKNIDLKAATLMKEFVCDNHLHFCAKTFIFMVISLARLRNADQKTSGVEHYDERLECIGIIVDILDYNKSMLEPFLEAIETPMLKMYFILHYFVKMAPKPIVKDMQVNLATSSIQEMFNCFVDSKDVRSICRCIDIDVLQTLLSHGFQTALLMHGQLMGVDVLSKHCQLLRVAFENLQLTRNKDFQLQTFAKNSLIIAEALSPFISCIN
ncbi:hypothetical protein O6H91_07G071100 [Diphasiastrum complanatum]|uniref:Uncharacterized protein n=1 Tax=Diphasiastrum complanatum TaxID=34168 RepID=A0ACC2D795_DIPCM|nr:hypothetical protein O6H91_07G071100 [Diphasiastrum complanatum]